eukprot:CAMPEP_0197038612 /NCGR_PEP_ID=MMETSP1384-20130603/15525_1 /TAXON_ID=29189 /ORGANISM="Ammonia sp." /LENGTH=419 /DNA_ID=CAMNT_0042469069 /DNA_START=6 /DNA_END=1265 /DNA_ORIENTATION=-
MATHKHKKQKKLPKHLEEIKENVFIEAEAPKHTAPITDIDAFAGLGIDNAWSIQQFLQDFQIEIQEIDEENNSMIFDMIGIDTSIANAFRRVLLAEVPTVAIEDCCVYQNNSILQDEVLCHRLGLIPIACDPRILNDLPSATEDSQYLGGNDPSNTLIFKLHVQCSKNPKAKENDPPHKKYINSIVTSGDIEWVPQPGQQEMLDKHQHAPIKMVHDDIIIAKLRPGQTIEIWMKAIKGIGRDHAKFSAVGTASYRLLPKIELDYNERTKRISLQNAQYFKNVCPKNVFDIEDSAKHRILVSRPRDCTVCRACIMDEKIDEMFGRVMDENQSDGKVKYEPFVKLRKKRNHFIFSIESIGQYPHVSDLFKEAIIVLKRKCQQLIDGVHSMREREDAAIDLDEEDGLGDEYMDGDDRMADID